MASLRFPDAAVSIDGRFAQFKSETRVFFDGAFFGRFLDLPRAARAAKRSAFYVGRSGAARYIGASVPADRIERRVLTAGPRPAPATPLAPDVRTAASIPFMR